MPSLERRINGKAVAASAAAAALLSSRFIEVVISTGRVYTSTAIEQLVVFKEILLRQPE